MVCRLFRMGDDATRVLRHRAAAVKNVGACMIMLDVEYGDGKTLEAKSNTWRMKMCRSKTW